MPFIPLGPWLPDLPAHMNPGLTVCKNCIPITDKSYGPFRDLSVYSGALNGAARCQGAFTAKDNSGNVNIFAGTATTLDRLTSSSTSFEDVSKTSGYATSAEDMWKFAQYGTRVIATNFTDPVQSYVIGSSTDFANLAGSPPVAKYVTVWKEHVVLGHLASNPQRIQWSAEGDPADWPTAGTSDAASKNADLQDIVEGEGGAIQGLVSGLGNADGAVFQERAIFRVTYVGAPLVFTIDRVEGARGCIAPGSIAQLGGTVIYLGEEDFYAFDGVQSVPLGDSAFAKTFFADLDQTYVSRMSATFDPINKIYYCAYPGSANSSGIPNKILAINWALKRASIIDEIETQFIFRAGTYGYNVDNAGSLGYNVDSSPFGPDSRFWSGGKSILGGFTTAHKLGFFSGSALEATFETGDMDQLRRVYVDGIAPMVDGGTFTASVGYRETPSGSVVYTTATSPEDDNFCAQDVSARFVRAKIVIAAQGTWSHASGFHARYKPDGER